MLLKPSVYLLLIYCTEIISIEEKLEIHVIISYLF